MNVLSRKEEMFLQERFKEQMAGMSKNQCVALCKEIDNIARNALFEEFEARNVLLKEIEKADKFLPQTDFAQASLN